MIVRPVYGDCEDARQRILVICKSPKIVIPERGIIARGICCSAAGKKQIPRQVNLASE
jgi:hypothetical protein